LTWYLKLEQMGQSMEGAVANSLCQQLLELLKEETADFRLCGAGAISVLACVSRIHFSLRRLDAVRSLCELMDREANLRVRGVTILALNSMMLDHPEVCGEVVRFKGFMKSLVGLLSQGDLDAKVAASGTLAALVSCKSAATSSEAARSATQEGVVDALAAIARSSCAKPVVQALVSFSKVAPEEQTRLCSKEVAQQLNTWLASTDDVLCKEAVELCCIWSKKYPIRSGARGVWLHSCT